MPRPNKMALSHLLSTGEVDYSYTAVPGHRPDSRHAPASQSANTTLSAQESLRIPSHLSSHPLKQSTPSHNQLNPLTLESLTPQSRLYAGDHLLSLSSPPLSPIEAWTQRQDTSPVSSYHQPFVPPLPSVHLQYTRPDMSSSTPPFERQQYSYGDDSPRKPDMLASRPNPNGHESNGPLKHVPITRAHKAKRPWTALEDEQLRTLTLRLGVGLWAAIAENIPGRTGKQVRERWLNHLSPQVVKRPWSPREDAIIIDAHAKYGNSWSKICKLLNSRSENMCKNRFHCKLSKMRSVGSAIARGPSDGIPRVRLPPCRQIGKQL